MKLLPLVLVALALGASVLAVAPAVEAKLACSDLTDPGCDGTLCVWNPVHLRFECTVDWMPPPWP